MRVKPSSFTVATLLIAGAFAGTVLLPHIFQRIDPVHPFQGVEIMPTDSEIHYAARVREIYDGFWTGNTYYSAPKDTLYLQPPLPEAIPAFIARMLGVDPVMVFIWWKAVCAFVLFLVMTGCFGALSGRRTESLIAVTILLFAGALLGAPWDLPKYIAGSSFFEPLRFARPINPLWTCSWFFGAIWFLARWTLRRSARMLVGVVLCTTVLVYSYVYAWTYLAAVFGFLGLWMLWKRDYMRVGGLILCGLAIGVLSLPYLLHVTQTMRDPLYALSSVRLGMVPVRTPIVGVWMIVFVGVVVLSFRQWRTTAPLIASLALGGILALNQQVITGHFIVPHHYHWYFFQPLAATLFMAMTLQIASDYGLQRRHAKTIASHCLVLGAIAFGILHQYRAYQGIASYWGEQQVLAPVLHFIDQEYRPGTSLYSQDIDILDLAPIYTSADVYDATNAVNYLVSPERVRDVHFFDLWVNGVSAEEAAEEFFTTRRSMLSNRLYAIYYRELLGGYDKIPDAVVAEQVEAYRTYLTFPDAEKISRYPLTAVVTTPTDSDTAAMRSVLRGGKKLFEANGYAVIELQ